MCLHVTAWATAGAVQEPSKVLLHAQLLIAPLHHCLLCIGDAGMYRWLAGLALLMLMTKVTAVCVAMLISASSTCLCCSSQGLDWP